MRRLTGKTGRRAMVLLVGLGFLTGGCDDQTRATVEDGIITASTSLFTAWLRAALEVAAEEPQ